MSDMPSASRHAGVIIAGRPLWQIRLLRALPRSLMYALACAGIVASARFAIAPPRPQNARAAAVGPEAPDQSAAAYAALFARRYLTWTSSERLTSVHALEPFTGAAMEAAAGMRLPANGEQHVEWLEIVQSRSPLPGEHVYTLAAQTDTAGLLYLTVSIQRQADGTLALTGYPAFIGAPAYGPARPRSQLREVSDRGLQTVVERALRNYMAGSEANLAADLTSTARVSLPTLGLVLESLGHLQWARGGGAVLAPVQAHDGRGVHYALEYELDVSWTAGRWEISAVEMDPTA
jgi:Conjugative transposon protein TcpC